MKLLLSVCLALASVQLQSTLAADPDQDRGWVSVIQYAPDSSFTYTLGNMRDGKNIRVFLGIDPGIRSLNADGEKRKIGIPRSRKSSGKEEAYEYQFKNYYTGKTRIFRKSTWEFSVERKITALRDITFSWQENFLNSHLIAGRSFLGNQSTKPIALPSDAVPPSEIFGAWGKVNRFKTVSIDSAIGRIDMKFGLPTMLVDYRRVSWRARSDAYLLYKIFSLKKGESVTLNMQIKITPDFDKLEQYVPFALEKDIYTPKNPLPSRHVVMPSPKKIEWKKDRFQLGLKARIYHHLPEERTVHRAQEFFAEMFQIDLQEGKLDERWKHSLLICNGKLPETIDREFKQMQQTLLEAKQEGSYALRVTGDAILISGKSERGLWNGLMTLFQLSRHQVSTDGIDYDQVAIVDHPAFKNRGIYMRVSSDLDVAWSRNFVAAMAELKYNQVYLHFSIGIGVRFRSQAACYDQDLPSISVEEFTELVEYIKSLNMEIIPIWASGKTMLSKKHFEKNPELAALTINKGINWDISLEETFQYHKSIIDEIISITGSKTIHLGLDEIYHFAQYCRNNTGRGDLILSEYINRFTDYYAPRGIRTTIYHDMLLRREDVEKPDAGHFAANAHEGSEKALQLLRHRDMLSIEDWSYGPNKIYSDFDYFFSKGFHVYGSCWHRYGNVRGLSAYTVGRADTFVCTYWSKPRNFRGRNWDPRGDRRTFNGKHKTYKFLPAMGLAGEAAWNADEKDLPYNFQEETLLIFNQRKGLNVDQHKCQTVDLAKWVNRDLADVIRGDGIGFIDQGRIMDLNKFPTGKQTFGGIPFRISESQLHQARAVSVKGAYTTNLPEAVRIPLKKERYASLVFLHTCHFDFKQRMDKKLSTHYVVTYEDGSTQKIQLANDNNIMTWGPSLTRFDPDNNNLWLAWTGTTEDGLPSNVYGYHWENPDPDKAILSVTLQSEANSDDSVFLLAITGIKQQ